MLPYLYDFMTKNEQYLKFAIIVLFFIKLSSC
jgi:hypothetical protein